MTKLIIIKEKSIAITIENPMYALVIIFLNIFECLFCEFFNFTQKCKSRKLKKNSKQFNITIKLPVKESLTMLGLCICK